MSYSPEEVIAGALFDFAGFLTTMDKPVTFSSRHEATSAVELLTAWAAKRGLSLDEARVRDWSATLRQQAARVDEGAIRSVIDKMRDAASNSADFHYVADQDDVAEWTTALEAALSAQPAERQGEAAKVADADIEAMRAAAMGIQHNKETWFPMTERRLRAAAKALLARHPAAPVGVPDGWVLVPALMTAELEAAMVGAWNDGPHAVHKAMLSAAPPAPHDAQGGGV
jgi:hypothetical protein